MTKNIQTAEKDLETVIGTLGSVQALATGRICVISPDQQMLPYEALYKLYAAQHGGTILIDITRTASLHKKEAYLRRFLDDVASLATKHRKEVLTVFVVSPGLKKYAEEAENAMPFTTMLWIRAAAPQKAAVPKKAAPQCSGMEQLEELVGLKEAKKIIRQAVDYGKAQKLYESRGFPPQKLGMHMVFSGNPGTAKTTTARLVAQIFKENGILSKGKLVEVGRADLIGKYVGWTAKQVKSVFKSAEGSVLFIDEAYSLLDDEHGQYGDEAINTIVQEMENHRQDMVVILAGYEQPMQEFLHRNPGLMSRITFQVPFPDYSRQELVEILHHQLAQHSRVLLPEDEEKVSDLLFHASGQENFGNGRYVRNLVEKAILAQASRLMALPPESITDDQIRCLAMSDFPLRSACKRSTPKQKIGFAI